MEDYFGLETFLRTATPFLTSQSSVLVAACHWALCRRTALCVGTGESGVEGVRSELLPEGWTSVEGVFCLRYTDAKVQKFLLKVVTADDMTILSLLVLKDNQSTDISLATHDFVEGLTLKATEVGKLVEQLDKQLLDPLMKPKEKSEVKTKKGDEKGNQPKEQPGRDPLTAGGRGGRVDPGPPGWDGVGPPALGGSDLDPLGGMMGGGMLMDPRGPGRGGHPRFDPVGPGMPGMPGFGGEMGGLGGMGGMGGVGGMPGRGGLGGRGGGRNFGDAMRPPSWDNMYM